MARQFLLLFRPSLSFPAALRELFRAKVGDYSSSQFSSGVLMRENVLLHQSENSMNVEARRKEENGETKGDMEFELVKTHSNRSCLVGLDHDTEDEFFDFSDTISLDDDDESDGVSCNYESTLPKDPTCNLPCSWTAADTSSFQIRGKTFLEDHKKIRAKGTLMQIVAVDWLRSDKREDDLASRPGSIVQKFAAHGGSEFFFIVNMQIPGSPNYSLAFYYMMSTPVEDIPLLWRFIEGDDTFRNSRFKLIPYVSKGPWIVKQSLGNRAALVGQMLKINYIRGSNYLELDIDVGSSTLARSVASLVFGYFNHLVAEIAFLIQATTPEELPENLIGTCRLNYLDISKTVWARP